MSLETILQSETDEAFIRALSDWNAFTIYGINLKMKEISALYLRLDQMILNRVSKLKKPQVEHTSQIENEIEEILKATWSVVDNLHYSKYLILFKSLDLLIEILTLTTRFTNLIQTVSLLSTILPIFKNKNLIVVELKPERVDDLILMLEAFVHNLNMLSSRRVVDVDDYLATKGADKTLSPKLKTLLRDPEFIVDTSRDDWVAQLHPDDPEMVDQRNERQLSFTEVMRYSEDQMANDLYPFVCQNLGRKKKPLLRTSPLWLALRVKIMFLRELNSTQCTVGPASLILQSQRMLQHILEDRAPKYVPLPVLPDWAGIERHITDPLNPKILMHLMDAKWAKVKVQAFKKQEFAEMHLALQKTLSSIIRRIEQDRTPLDQLATEDRDEKLVAVNEDLIIACAELGSHIYENDATNKHTDEDEMPVTSIDFSLSFDSASSILTYLIDDQHDYLHFSPKLVSHVMEFIKHDIGACQRVLPRILDAMAALIKKPIYAYKSEGKILPISTRRYTEFLNELVELLDSIFVEPLKGKYTSSLPGFAKEAAEHPVWEKVADLPEELSGVLNPIVVYLDDILTEIPENLVNPTLKHLKEVKVTQRLIDNFFQSDSLDYEFIGFFIQFLGKHIYSTARFADLDEILDRTLKLAFRKLLDRKLITQNLKRFANADSTSSLVVLAEEIIDLVNIQHSLTDVLLGRFDAFLTEADQFYSEVWAALSELLTSKDHRLTNQYPNLAARGWTFTEDPKDNLIMLDKLNQNLFRFMGKFYDFRRTNIFESFPKIRGLERFITLMQQQPLFDSNMTKIRKIKTQSLLKMIEHHKILGEVAGEDGFRQSQFDLLKMILNTSANTIEYLTDKWAKLSQDHQQLFCGFLFRQNEVYLSLELSKSGSASSAELSEILLCVNKYLHVTLMVDVFKNASIISNRAQQMEAELGQILLKIWTCSIKFESQLAQTKAVWLAERFQSYKIPALTDSGTANEPTGDHLFNHLFGCLDVYRYEMSSKGYERILKHLLSGPNESKPEVMNKFAREIAVTIEKIDIPEEPTFLNAIQLVQNICFLKSFLATFDGIAMQTLLKKHKVFVFCIKSILFAFKFISEHKNTIQEIKSIPDSRKHDPNRPLAPPKSENLVKLTLDQIKMRFLLDALCEQLEVCWKILRTSFELQDPGNTTKEEELRQEVELYGLRYTLLDGLAVIISSVNDDFAAILDLDDVVDDVKPLTPPKNKAQPAAKPEPEQPKIVVKNVSKGHKLLENLFRFMKFSYRSCLGLLPKYQKLVNFTESPKNAQPAPDAADPQANPEPEEGEMMMEPTVVAKIEADSKTKIVNELESVKPEDLHYLNHNLCLTKEQFVELSKKKLEKILDGVYPAKASIFGNDPTLTVQAYLAFLSKQPDFKRHTQQILNKINNNLGEIRSMMFFKSDGSTTPNKEKFRISNGFIKHFRAGKYTVFRQLQTHLSMVLALHDLNQTKKLGLTFQRELSQVVGWLTDILHSFHKLVEIKSLSMEPENFRRRYSRVVQMINRMFSVAIILNKTIKEEAAGDATQKGEPAQQKHSSATKMSGKKLNPQQNKEGKQLDTLKSDLVTAISEYLGNYPTFMRQKINLLDGTTVACICNLLFDLGKEKPEIREAIRHLEIVKKLCRAGYFTDRHDSHSTIDLASIRGFLALVEDQARSERLLQETLRLEIKQYLETQESVLLERKLKSLPEGTKLEPTDLPIEDRFTPLTQFESTFNRIGQEHMDVLLKITKDRCIIHQKGNDRYIGLAADKKEKEFILDGDSISTMIILLKEIVRCSANIIFDRTSVSGEKFVPCKQTISLPLMMECLQFICKRFPLLLKMVATHNISKFVKKVKSPWVKDRFFNEIKHNRNITFLQFYVRVILFIDFKHFRNFFLISSQDSYVHVLDEEKTAKTHTKLPLGSWIRKTYFRELSTELDKLGQQIQLLLTQPKYAMQNTNEIGMPNKYFIMRLASTYCTLSQDVSSLLPFVRQSKSTEGEFRIGAIQQKLTKMVESFSSESEKNFEALHEILCKSLCFTMKMNFLCAANQQKLEEYDAAYNFKNLGLQRDCVHVHLNDFESFRAKTIDEQLKTFRKPALVWHDAALDLNRFKEIRDFSGPGEPLMMSGVRWGQEDGEEDLGEEEEFDDDEDDDDGFDDDDEELDIEDHPSGSEHEGSDSRFDQEQMIDEAEVDEFLEHNQVDLLGPGRNNRRNMFMPGNQSLTTEFMSADLYEYSDELDGDEMGEEEEDDAGEEEDMDDEFYDSQGEEEGEEEIDGAGEEGFESSDEEIPLQDNAEIEDWRLAENNLHQALQNLARPRPVDLNRLDFLNFAMPQARERNPFLPPPPFMEELPPVSASNSEDQMFMDEDSSERSSENLLRIRFSAGRDDMMSDIFRLSSRVGPFSPFDAISGAARPNQPLKDAFYQIGDFYPFFDCIRVSGLLQVTLVDQQLTEYISSFENLLENWENQHALSKWSFHENSIALYRLRESNKEDLNQLKNYIFLNDKRRQGGPARAQKRLHAYQIGGFQIGQRRRSIGGLEEEIPQEPRGNHLNDFMSMVNQLSEANRLVLRDQDMMAPLRRLNSNQEPAVADTEGGSLLPLLLREVPIIQHQQPIQQKRSINTSPSKTEVKDPQDPLGLNKFLNPKVNFDWQACGLEENFLQQFGIDLLFFSALDLGRQAELVKAFLKPAQIPQFNSGVSKMMKNNPQTNLVVPNPIPPRPRASLRTDFRNPPFSIFSSAAAQGLSRSRSNSRLAESWHELLL